VILAASVGLGFVKIEAGKHWFYRSYRAPATPAPRHRTPEHRVRRRAARFTARTLRPARQAGPPKGMP
jgi:hypothetical protein